jgi:hypothetical protein
MEMCSVYPLTTIDFLYQRRANRGFTMSRSVSGTYQPCNVFGHGSPFVRDLLYWSKSTSRRAHSPTLLSVLGSEIPLFERGMSDTATTLEIGMNLGNDRA